MGYSTVPPVSIIYDRHEDVLQVPRSAIIETASDTYVMVVEDNVATRKSVETDFSSNGMVEITSGLTDAEKVITVGHVGLKNEAQVVVINAPVDNEQSPVEEPEPVDEGAE